MYLVRELWWSGISQSPEFIWEFLQKRGKCNKFLLSRSEVDLKNEVVGEMIQKVLILANNSAGLYDFRHELIVELQRRAEVCASTPFDDKMDELKALNCGLIRTEVDRRGINPLKDLKLLWDYFKVVRREKPDLAVTYTIKPNVYGGLMCRILRVPYAANITGLGTAFEKQSVLRSLVVGLYKAALKKAKVVFFENGENAQIFLDEKIISGEQACSLNGAGVNLTRYTPVAYPPEREEMQFLFMGRVMEEKGIDELLGAVKRLSREGIACTLDVLGYLEEDYRAKMEQCEQEGWLRYHGYQQDVRPFVAACDCFVLPSWHEGMANTNLECAASARPIITSDIPGCREAVIDGVSGYLCKPKNEQSLFDALLRFARLPREQREAMGLAGRSLMEEKFDKRKVVAETVSRLLHQ